MPPGLFGRASSQPPESNPDHQLSEEGEDVTAARAGGSRTARGLPVMSTLAIIAAAKLRVGADASDPRPARGSTKLQPL